VRSPAPNPSTLSTPSPLTRVPAPWSPQHGIDPGWSVRSEAATRLVLAICPPEAPIVLTKSLEQWALQTAEGKDEVLKAKNVALKIALDALADKQTALEGAEQRHLQEICKYKLMYQGTGPPPTWPGSARP
jgi:hypothetical protein